MNLKKASRQRGVCVEHLKRCKTSYSFDLVQFYFVLAGGWSVTFRWLHPTKLHHDALVIWTLGTLESTYLLTSFSFSRQWRPAKPRTGMSLFSVSVASGPSSELQCQQVSLSIVRFSQSELLPTSSDGTVAFCKDKESNLLLQWFSSPCHPTLTCQTLRDCLCTTDALHNSNSIRIF